MENGQTSGMGAKIISCSEVEALLDDYIDGEIDELTRARFEQHVQRCESCSSLVLDCRHIIAVAKSLADEPVPADVSHRLRKRLEEEMGCKLPGPHLHLVNLESK